MHEMSLAENVRGIIEDAARAQPFTRVRVVVLEIGELAAVEIDALLFCMEAVLRDTVADGARIEIEAVPGTGWCIRCSVTIGLTQLYDPCPHCGGFQVQPTGGTELRVKALDVE
jgi:hydrogenase nickel incorporation protein HypA/HybF